MAFRLARCVLNGRGPGRGHSMALTKRPISTCLIRLNEIDTRIENGIRTITINRPQKHNALTEPMFRQMAKSMAEGNDDNETKIIVVTGSGDKYFTSGWDLNALIEDYKKRVQFTDNGPASLIRSLIECRKPLVALVNGSAVGIGVTLLGHCDAVYASDKAILNTPFILLGIPPEACSSYLFPKIFGYAKAGSLLHFNDYWTAQEACQNGLITRVFPQTSFQTEAWNLVREMAKYPSQSLLQSKLLLRERERETLRKVFQEEMEKFDIEFVGENAMKMLASRKK